MLVVQLGVRLCYTAGSGLNHMLYTQPDKKGKFHIAFIFLLWFYSLKIFLSYWHIIKILFYTATQPERSCIKIVIFFLFATFFNQSFKFLVSARKYLRNNFYKITLAFLYICKEIFFQNVKRLYAGLALHILYP